MATRKAVPDRMPEGTCTIQGCNATAMYRGLCILHLEWWVNGAQGKPPQLTSCAYPFCEENRTHGNYCAEHAQRVRQVRGSRKPQCSVEGCDNPVRAAGLCNKHYLRQWRHGDPETVKTRREEDRPVWCKVPGCGKPHKANGYCAKHNQRYRRHGDPTVTLINRGDPVQCNVDGCEDPAEAKGYCRRHYKRVWQYGDPQPDFRRAKRPKQLCSVEGCEEHHVALGYCRRHYNRFKRWGDPLIVRGKKVSR